MHDQTEQALNDYHNGACSGHLSGMAISQKVNILRNPGKIKEISLRAACSPDEVVGYTNLLQEYRDIFTWDYSEMSGLSPTVIEHHIDTWPDIPPVHQKQLQLHPYKAEAIKQEINKLHKVRFIYPMLIPTLTFLSLLLKNSEISELYSSCINLESCCIYPQQFSFLYLIINDLFLKIRNHIVDCLQFVVDYLQPFLYYPHCFLEDICTYIVHCIYNVSFLLPHYDPNFIRTELSLLSALKSHRCPLLLMFLTRTYIHHISALLSCMYIHISLSVIYKHCSQLFLRWFRIPAVISSILTLQMIRNLALYILNFFHL